MRTQSLVLLLLIVPCTPVLAAAGNEGHFFTEVGVGTAEHGAGPRASFGVGYAFDSGWSLALTRQRLHEVPVVTSFSSGDGSHAVLQAHPEVRSTALLFGREWALGATRDWRARAYAGLHHWTLDATIRIPRDGSWPEGWPDTHVSASDTRPAMRIELARQLASRVSLGLSLERYWLGNGQEADRAAITARFDFGGDGG